MIRKLLRLFEKIVPHSLRIQSGIGLQANAEKYVMVAIRAGALAPAKRGASNLEVGYVEGLLSA